MDLLKDYIQGSNVRAHKMIMIAYATLLILFFIGLSLAAPSIQQSLTSTWQAMSNDDSHNQQNTAPSASSFSEEACQTDPVERNAGDIQSQTSLPEELGIEYYQAGSNSEPLPNCPPDGRVYYPELDGPYGYTPTFGSKEPEKITNIPIETLDSNETSTLVPDCPPDGRVYYPELDGPYGYTPTYNPKEPDSIPLIPPDF